MSASSDRSRPTTIQHREQVMGTVVTIDAFSDAGIEPTEYLAYLARALSALHRADKVFSTWKADSPVSRLRRGEITLGEAPPEVHEVLALCRTARDLSGGWFDPWSIPGGVDPTGYVKGWAAQVALGELEGAGLDGAMVNAAGDITSFGGPAAGEAFHVGIVNPDTPLQLACAVELRGALATSGTYERGEHLIDPHTRTPLVRVASASVTGPDLGLADALATAIAVGGDDVRTMIEGIDGYEAFTIGLDATWRWTTGFPFVQGAQSASA
jgi:thiamine biosynthesis lipoprotein